MKSITKMTAAALAVSVLGASFAQAATTVAGTVSATVIGPLAIVQTTPLSFGSFSASATAGTITSFGVTTGGVTNFSAGSPAVFTVTGNPNTNFSITSPASVVLNSGANSMTAALTTPTSSALDNVGSRIFNTIGTLTVAANQASGAYTGTYNVSVNY